MCGPPHSVPPLAFQRRGSHQPDQALAVQIRHRLHLGQQLPTSGSGSRPVPFSHPPQILSSLIYGHFVFGWGNRLRFLDDPRIEPTNNRAERALRPAVIARKVSHCSKNTNGANAFACLPCRHRQAAFTSVVQTLAQRGEQSIVEGLYQIF